MSLVNVISDMMPENMGLRVGIVIATSPLTVSVQGGAILVHRLNSYTPAIGNNVALLRLEQTWLVLGQVV